MALMKGTLLDITICGVLRSVTTNVIFLDIHTTSGCGSASPTL